MAISDAISRLPQELLSDIFSRLDANDLARCSRVNSYWNKIANEDRLWRQIQLELPAFNNLSASLVDKLARAQSLTITNSLTCDTLCDPSNTRNIHCMTCQKYPKLHKLNIQSIFLNESTREVGALIARLSYKLRDLSLRQTLVLSDIFLMVDDMPNLENLDLSYTGLDNSGLMMLATVFKCQSLRQLRLDSVYQVTRYGMSAFLNEFTAPNLHTLSLNYNQNLVFQSLKDFVRRHQRLALCIKGIDHFTIRYVKEIQQVGSCRSIEHTTILEDWTLEAIRRYVDYLASASQEDTRDADKRRSG